MTLEDWLSVATRGLSQKSVERVRAEIQQHCESASENGDYAIGALGDPKAANRAYCKVLLTEMEAKLLNAMRGEAHPARKPERHGKILAGILVGEAAFVLTFFVLKNPPLAFFFIPFAVIPLLARLLPINTPQRGLIYRLVRWGAMLAGSALAALFGVPTSPKGLLGVFIPMLIFERVFSSIRRKVPVSEWPKNLYF